jgi:hypothetical protein
LFHHLYFFIENAQPMQKALLFLFICLSTTLFAQGGIYQSGYVITLQGDTLNGYIYNGDWLNSPDQIKFVTKKGAKEQIFEAINTKGFVLRMSNAIFESKEITYNLYEKEVQRGGSAILDTIKAHFFIEKIFADTFGTLYGFHESYGDHFYLDKGGRFQELIHYEYYLNRKGQRFNIEKNTFRDQLQYYYGSCDKIYFNNIKYKKENLLKTMQLYSECNGGKKASTYEQQDAQKTKRNNIGVYGGAFYRTNIDKPKDLILFTGLSYRYNFAKNFNNRYAQIEFGYGKLPDKKTLVPVDFAILGGTRFGSGRNRPFAHAGSNIVGFIFGTGYEIGNLLNIEARIMLFPKTFVPSIRVKCWIFKF